MVCHLILKKRVVGSNFALIVLFFKKRDSLNYIKKLFILFDVNRLVEDHIVGCRACNREE